MTQTKDSIDEQAARWVMRADASPLTSQEQTELDAWLATDPRHRGAYVRARARWMDLERFDALAANLEVTAEAAAPPLPTRMGRRFFLAAAAAGTAVCIGALTWRNWREDVYASNVGEVRRIALPDRSTLLLNTASEVRIAFDEIRRQVVLSRGEALFEVARDLSRPFLVQAGTVLVRAVAAVFLVRVFGERTEVTVKEGMVEVAGHQGAMTRMFATQKPQELEAIRTLTANQQLAASSSLTPRIASVTSEEMRRQLAWREGMVIFDGQPLREAVEEVNRYNQRKIRVANAVLAGRPVVGMFRANDIESFAQATAAALGARVVIDGDAILIEPADGSS